jgi:arginase
VLSVPQWQGSSAEHARRLVEGAHRTASLIPVDAVVTAPVLSESGPVEDGVRSLDVLVSNSRRVRETLSTLSDLVITTGGDCGVDLAPITTAHTRHGDDLTVLWIDAHPDVYSPTVIRSFHGMVVRTLLGDGPRALSPVSPLSPSQIILAGVRTADPTEYEYIAETGLQMYGVEDLAKAFEGLTGPVYVHVDLDVLDPAAFGSTCYPVPDGVTPSDLATLLSTVDNLVGAAITEHAPAGENPAEAEVIRELGAALCR